MTKRWTDDQQISGWVEIEGTAGGRSMEGRQFQSPFRSLLSTSQDPVTQNVTQETQCVWPPGSRARRVGGEHVEATTTLNQSSAGVLSVGLT